MGNTNTARVARLTLKELRETLRDRRTIITLILMPVLVYPLLSVAFQRLLLSSFRGGTTTTYVIGLTSDDDWNIVGGLIRQGEELLTEENTRAESATPASDDGPLNLVANRPIIVEPLKVDDLEQAVAGRIVDLGVRVVAAEDESQPPQLDLMYLPKFVLGVEAREYVERRLRAVNDEFLRERLRELNIQASVAAVEFHVQPVADASGTSAFSASALVPLILVLMTITGAVYPAIDLTAGERERGTLETLIAAPVPRLGLLLAKYAAVLTVAVLTATVNLAAMTVTVIAIDLGPVLFGEAGLSARVVVQVFSLLLLFAAFFSGVLLAITSFARSFKEAQAYLIPVMLFALTPGVMSLMPGLKLEGVTVATPLLNVVLLARDLIDNRADPVTAAVVVLSTAMYTLAAIAVAARIFGTDAILYGSQGNWSDMIRRSPVKLTTAPPSTALFCLAILFPAQFLAANMLARLQALSIDARIILPSLAAALIFAGLPLAVATFQRIDVTTGFQLYAPRLLSILGAIVLGFSLWPGVLELLLLARNFGPTGLSDETLKWAKGVVEHLQQASPVLVLLSLAVVPALVEEFFFRGFLMGAFLPRSGPARAIVYSGVLFGLFHLIAKDALAVERLLPSTLLGLVLGWVCYRTGSVIPGMVLHACHNGVILVIAQYQNVLERWGWGAEVSEHLPLWGVALSLVAAACGLFLIHIGGRVAPRPVLQSAVQSATRSPG